MFFLLSGEGPTDIGSGVNDGISMGEDFHHGAMTAIADQVVEKAQDYSILQTQACGFVSEGHLSHKAAELKAVKKAVRLPGKKTKKETRYFFNSARVLGRIAKEQQDERDDLVVAVLFRDSDGTASAGRGLWAEKRESMMDGFDEEEFERGVPMIPKPKSEAWLLCATKANPYQNCEALEEESGNDNSPNSLKTQFAASRNDAVGREEVAQLLTDGEIDIDRIDMPSFRAFRERLEEVI